jgi:putative phosphoesterase
VTARIGVISDTHNYLDPQVARLFQGVDHILHGGDVGLPRLILELEQIAPVTAVLGNTDEAGLGLKVTEVVEVAGRKFLVHHIVNPQALEEPLRERIEREQPAAVIFGHSHKPFNQTIQGRLFFNPGYAGHSRFGMNRSVAILKCEKNRIIPQYFPL